MKTIRVRTAAQLAAFVFIAIGGGSNARAQSMFNHSIPIKLPKGANGMQPEITLVYDPAAGNGLVGVGWQLGGLSAITRVNNGSGITYTGHDTYAHTQLGVLVAQSDGTYRSKKESFTKLVPSGTCGDGPCSWAAYDRSGTQYTYGNAATGVSTAAGPGSSVRLWALSKVQDLLGNYYEVTYSADNGQLYPSVVTYTKGPGLTTYRTVEFSYESRSDTDPGYPQGVFTQMLYRLKWIRVKSSGTLLHQYRLDYGEYGAATSRSHLTAVQEYGADGSTLPAQTFSWQQGGTGFSWERWGTNHGAWVEGIFLPGDFNGDGRTDAAYLFHDTGDVVSVEVQKSTGSSLVGERWSTGAGSWLGGDWVFVVGDFNGDGKADIACAFNDGGSVSIDVRLSTGSSFVLQRWITRWGTWRGGTAQFMTGDFDGDGKTDIAYVFDDNGITIDMYHSAGTSFTASRWATQQGQYVNGTLLTGDFDGDGKTDIAFVFEDLNPNPTISDTVISIDVHRSQGSYFSNERWITAAGMWPGGPGSDSRTMGTFLTGDFNGDGKIDIVHVFNDNGGRSYDVYASTGSSFSLGRWATQQGSWVGDPGDPQWQHYAQILVGDFDGDGKSDIVYTWNDNGNQSYDVHSSTGTSFGISRWGTAQGPWVDGTSYPPQSALLPGDYDGDGRADLLYAWNDGGGKSFDMHRPNGTAPDLLTTVNNGLGGTVTISYLPAPQVANAILPSSSGPGIPNTSPQKLVTGVTTSDGRGGSYSTSYNYWDARVLPGSISNQRDVGFSAVRAIDNQTGQYKQTSFYQYQGYEGLPYKVDEVAGNGALVSSTSVTYDLVSPSAGTELARERQRVVSAYEYTLQALAFTQTTSTQYDDYGNPTVKVQSADALPDVTVTTTFVNDTSAWILGRITEVKTTSGGTTLSWMKNTWAGNTITTKSNWLDATNTWISSTMTYDANGNLVTVTEPATADHLVRTTTTAYDATFKTYPISVTNALGQSTQRSYNADGLVVSFTDANNWTTTTTYDAFGRKIATTRVADGARTTFSYSNPGSVNGVPTLYNLVVMQVDATRTIYRKDFFDGTGFVFHTESTGDVGQTVCSDFQRDTAGRQYAASTPHSCNATTVAWTRSTYDAAGRLSTVTTPDSRVTSYKYGVSSTRPNSTAATDANGNTTTKYFDARKQVTSIVDAANQTTTYAYDALGRLTSTKLPDLSVTQITYDSLNRRASVLDPQVGTNSVSFTYDALNRVTSKQAAGEPAVTYKYDETDVANGIGRLTTLVDAAGTTRFAYTSTGLLARRTSTYGSSNFSETLQYDLADRPIHITYPDGSYVDYSYTDAGNLSSVSLNGASLASYSDYTAGGKPGKVTYGNGISTTYAYDNVNHITRLSTVGTTAGTIQDLTYDWYTRPNTGGLNIGSITDNRPSKVGADGVNTDETQAYTYDALYRLKQADGVWGTKAYAYDAIGNPTGFAGLVSRTLTFTGQQVTSGTGLSAVTYDGFGNTAHRVIDGATWDYAWTGQNHLASASRNGTTVAQMTYDSDGHRVKKVFTPFSGPTVTTIYFDKLYEMRTYSDGSPARHTVNVFAGGQLLVSVTRAGNIAVAFNDVNRWRIEAGKAAMYDGRTLLGAARKGLALLAAAAIHPDAIRDLEFGLTLLFAIGLAATYLLSRGTAPRQRRRPAWLRLAAASVAVVFVHTGCGGPGGGGGDLHQQHGSNDLLSGDTTKGPAIGTYYYHRNHINSSSVITDSGGNVTARMVYLPFGELTQANSSGGDVVTSKFTGQEYDEELGLYYYGARYYDPAIGRFISADSVVPSASDAQSFNRYSYVRDNPIVYVDPTGHFLDFIGDFFSSIWQGISAVGSAIATVAHWAYSAAVAYVKFCARVCYFIGRTLYGIATNPIALASFVLGAILCCTIVGIPEGLYMFALSASISITATSMAQAAGVTNPYVLAVIGVAAGVAAGGWSWGQFLKSLGQTAVGMMATAIGGAPGGLAADVVFAAVGAVDPEVNNAGGGTASSSPSTEGDFNGYTQGGSFVVYNPVDHTIGIYDLDGTLMFQQPAYNRTASNSNGPWPPGTYDFVGWHEHGPGDDWYGPNEAMGSNGGFAFDVPGRDRNTMLVHAGREAQGGPNYPTFGCIRTTDPFTAYMRDANFNGFPIQYIIVLPRNNFPYGP